MPILLKGYTFTAAEQVTSTKLGNLVDSSTFTSGAVDGVTTDLSSGAIIVKNGGITPTKLSTGYPNWDSSSNLTVGGTLTATGAISTSSNLTVTGTLSTTGTSTFVGNATFTNQIIRSGTASSRTVELKTGASSPNAISFGFNNGDLLVTIDGSEFKVTLTSVP
jgi:hypothetical protein